MGVAEVSPLVLRDSTICRLDYECRFALIALMAAAGPKARFEWDAQVLAEAVLPNDPSAAILFSRLLSEVEHVGIAQRYAVGGREYGQVVLPILVTSYSVGYRRSNRGARYPAPSEDAEIPAPPPDETAWLAEFQLFWSTYPFHDNIDKAKAAWMALRRSGIAPKMLTYAWRRYLVACLDAVGVGHEYPRIGASAFLTEAWVGYLEGKL